MCILCILHYNLYYALVSVNLVVGKIESTLMSAVECFINAAHRDTCALVGVTRCSTWKEC